VAKMGGLLKRSMLYQLGGPNDPSLGTIIEQVQLAEEVGLDTVWVLPALDEAERFEEGAPELWLAALADRTRRIRLGWGRAGLMHPERAPLRVAEQAGSLDVLSGGRLDLVLLPGPAVRREHGTNEAGEGEADWKEGYRMLAGMWTSPIFAWRSPRFELAPVEVVPKPVQQPHPPLWLAGWSEAHAQSAGRGGLGYLDVSGGADDQLERALFAYRAGRAEAEPEDLVSVEAFGVLADLMPGQESVDRLAGWEALGVDQAVARFDPAVARPGELDGLIRFLAPVGGGQADIRR